MDRTTSSQEIEQRIREWKETAKKILGEILEDAVGITFEGEETRDPRKYYNEPYNNATSIYIKGYVIKVRKHIGEATFNIEPEELAKIWKKYIRKKFRGSGLKVYMKTEEADGSYYLDINIYKGKEYVYGYDFWFLDATPQFGNLEIKLPKKYVRSYLKRKLKIDISRRGINLE